MPSNIGPALGIVAETFAKRLGEKHKEAHDDEVNRFNLISEMVKSGMTSGAVDPNQAMSFLMENAPGGKKGGKGGKGGQQPEPWKNLIGGIVQAGKHAGFGDQQAAPMTGMPNFLSAQQVQAQKDDATIAFDKKRWEEVGKPEAEYKSELDIKREQAKPFKGVRDKEPTQKPDGSWAYMVREPDGRVIYEEPAQAPKAKTPLEKEAELVQSLYPTLDPARAKQVAATRIEDRTNRDYNLKRDRAIASLSLSRAQLGIDQERLSEMKQFFPLTLATRSLGVDIANSRSIVESYRATHPQVAAGIPDRQAHQNPDGSWSISVRARDGSGQVLYEQPADESGNRIALNEDKFAASQSALGARLAAGRTATDARTAAAGRKAAADVLKEATRLTESAYRAESGADALVQSLGLGTSKTAYMRQLVKEMTGMEYDDVLEEAQGLTPETAPPEAPTTPPPARGSAPPTRSSKTSSDVPSKGGPPKGGFQVDDVVQGKDGKRHKVIAIQPDGQLVLDKNPLP